MNEPAGAELPDAELLRAHVDGDPDAFATLFRRHRDRLWGVALRTMGNPEDAADGLQDGMIAAYRRAGSFRGEAAVTTWLHRVVVNACLDRLRSAKVRRADPLPEDRSDVGDRGSLVTSPREAADSPDPRGRRSRHAVRGRGAPPPGPGRPRPAAGRAAGRAGADKHGGWPPRR